MEGQWRIEDGRTIELISIGVVAEDGREYYAVSTEFDAGRAGPWVRTNVLPKLPSPASPVWRSRSRIRADLEATTLYFDKLHTVRVAGSLADIGLTLPTGLVTRLRPEDLSGSQGSYQLRLEILRRVNLVIAPAKVNAVLIEEMLIN